MTRTGGTSPAPWHIRLLGGLRAEQADRVVTRFRSARTGALLAYLALHADRLHPRERLIDLFWADADLESGRHNLNNALSALRAALEKAGTPTAASTRLAPVNLGSSHDPPEQAPKLAVAARGSTLILADRQTVGVNPALIITDVAEFRSACQLAEMAPPGPERLRYLLQAAALYQGELLPGVYDEWVALEREQLSEQHRSMLQRLTAETERAGDLEGALEWARQAVNSDPLCEEAHQDVIRLYASLGRPADARRQYEAMERRLREELDVAPSVDESWLAATLAAPGRTRTPEKAPTAARHNLPCELTSFVGRTIEAETVKELLGQARLVTLTGSGGVGKSRLALKVADEVLEEYPDGVWLAELAPVTDPALVPATVAQPLGVAVEGDRPLLQSLIEHLKPKSLLMILDNCEHLLEACAGLVESLLRSCPKLKVLASSREGLGIFGETTYRVPSLGVPAADVLSGDLDRAEEPLAGGLLQYDAVRLLVDRAGAAQPGFAITGQNARSLVEVCRRLDGIPLAVELAAARVKVMTLEQIALRLDDAFRLLTGGSRTALPRQQTLRALIDWSYDLLNERERTLLRRLSVFMGGWTLEGAEAVCAGAGIEEWEVLDWLTSLVDKSLVVFEETAAGTGPAAPLPDGRGTVVVGGGKPVNPQAMARYRLLETVRQYARDRLLESGEAEAVRGRHLAYFLAFAEESEARCKGPEQPEWLDRLEAEHDNLRSALEWAGSKPESTEKQLRLAAALGHFWDTRGYQKEGIDWLERALGQDVQVPAATRARALEAACFLGWWKQMLTNANREWFITRLEEATELYRQVGDTAGLSRCLVLRSVPGFSGSDLEARLAMARESTELARSQPDRHTLGFVLWLAAEIECHFGDREEGIRLLEEGLQVARALGQPGGVSRHVRLRSFWVPVSGNAVQARPLLEEALVLSRKVGDKRLASSCLERLAPLDALAGEEAQMIERLEQMMAISRDTGDPVSPWIALQLARALLRRGDVGRAKELLRVSAGQMDVGQIQAQACWLLSRLARRDGDEETARRYEEKALRLAREAEELDRIHVLGALGHAARGMEEYEDAHAFYTQSLELRQKLKDAHFIAQSLEDHGVLAVMTGEHERAARLLGATEVQAERLGRALPIAVPEDFRRAVAASKAAMGEEAFATAWAEGRAMSLEQAVAYALVRDMENPDSNR